MARTDLGAVRRAFVPAASRAVLIGVTDYPNFAQQVPAAQHNVEELAKAFQDTNVWGLGSRLVTCVHNPDRTDLVGYVEDAANLVREDGVLVVYFAGHAQRVGRSLALVPHTRSDDPADYVAVEQLADAVRGTPASHTVLILDCCYAGRASWGLPSDMIAAGAESTGWQLLAATGNEVASDARSDEKHTPFTGALLQVLSEGWAGLDPASAPEWLSPGEVLDAIGELLRTDPSLPVPAQGPTAFDRGWVRNRKYVPPERRARRFPVPRRAGAPYETEAAPPDDEWPRRREPFVGRTEELARAGRFLARTGAVVPVVGPRHSGKKYFVDEVIARSVDADAPPDNLCLIRLNVANSSAPEPVLEQLAVRLNVTIDALDDFHPDRTEAIRQKLGAKLSMYLGGRRLLMFVEGSRLGTNPESVRADLERLLELPVFANALVIVTTQVELGVSGGGQLRQLAMIQMGELSEAEATELVNLVIAEQDPTIPPLASVGMWQQIDDALARLPGMLCHGVDELVNEVWNAKIDSVTVEHLHQALLRRSAPTVGTVLRDVHCDALWVADDELGRRPGPLAFLAAWAITDGLMLTTSLLAAMQSGLDVEPVRHLVEARLLTREERHGFTWLSLGSVTRHALKEFLLPARPKADPLTPYARPTAGILDLEADDFDAAVAQAMSALVPTVLARGQRHERNHDTEVMHAVRRAIGWLDEREEARCPQLRQALNTLAAGHLADAALSPIAAEAPVAATATGADAAVSETARNFAVIAGAARLNQAMRAGGQTQAISEAFAAAADEVAEAIANCHPETLSFRLLKSIDTALFIGGRRLRTGTRTLAARERAVDKLFECARSQGGDRPDLINVAVSWLLNTADVQMTAGRRTEAKTSVAGAEQLVGMLPEPVTLRDRFAQLQMRQRISCAVARCAEAAAERVAALQEAQQAVCEGLALSETDADRSLWSMRLSQVAGLLVAEQPSHVEQQATCAEVIARLDAAWGGRSGWPGELRARIWQLSAAVHRADQRVAHQLEGAKQALSLVIDFADVPRGVVAEAHLFVARCLRRNNRLREGLTEGEVALRLARDAYEQDRTPEAFLRELRILRTVGAWRAASEHPRLSGGVAGAGQPRDRMLLRRIREAQEWLEAEPGRTWAYAVLDLWCHRARWSMEGNLMIASTPEGREPTSLKREERLENLHSKYRYRRNKLNGHLDRYGHSVELLRMEVALERQYRRWLSVLELHTEDGLTRRRNVDNKPVWALLKAARRRWPDHPGVIEANAEFHRYIWQHLKAVDLYRRAMVSAQRGDDRLAAALSMVEAIVSYAQFGHPHTVDPVPLLHEAAQVLADERRDGPLLEQLVLLRARVNLELGEPVDWTEIETVGNEVLSGGYAAGVSAWLNARRHHGSGLPAVADPGVWHISADSPLAELVMGRLNPQPPPEEVTTDVDDEVVDEPSSSLGDFLRENFTELHLLRGLGSLYLRRAEVEKSLAHAHTAYDLFDGCRVFQEAGRLGRSTPVTKFLMARAILLAAQLRGSADPFDTPSPREGVSWLRYAEMLFQSCKDETVGAFGGQCSHFRGETSALLHRLTAAG